MQQEKNRPINDAVIKEIIKSLENIKYGQIQITVHNSKVVQIDKTEKTRFDDSILEEKRR
ncbi:MAG: YezD family protein [bacterium]|nr:YezD family protein [bacterium]